MKIKKILHRIYVNDLESELEFYENLCGESCQSVFQYKEIGLELAQVGDFIIIAGDDEHLKHYRYTQATFLVDSIQEFREYLLQTNSVILRDIQKVPTGYNMTVQHADGNIFEYVEHL